MHTNTYYIYLIVYKKKKSILFFYLCKQRIKNVPPSVPSRVTRLCSSCPPRHHNPRPHGTPHPSAAPEPWHLHPHSNGHCNGQQNLSFWKYHETIIF